MRWQVTTEAEIRSRWFIAGAVCIGAALRVYGLDFGLPHPQVRPDEGVLLHRALSVASGDLNPHFFNYPTLHIYLNALACGLYFLFLLAVGWVDGSSQFVARFIYDPSELYLVGRSLSALFGTATIPACALLAYRLAGHRAAVIAAWLLAVAFLHVRDSHFLTVDIPATFWGCLAMALLIRSAHTAGTRPRPAWSEAAALGLAMASKYNLALFLPALVYAGFSRHPDSARAGSREVAVLLVVAAATFFMASPYVLLDAATFAQHLAFEARHFGRGHGEVLGNGWWYHLSVSLRYGLGLPLLLASLGGLAWIAGQRDRRMTPLLLAVVTYFIVSGAGNTLFVRYALPLIPLLCAAAAVWLAHVTRETQATGIVLALLLGSIPLSRSVQHVSLLSTVDSRVLAGQWIESHVPEGETIAMAGTDYVRPALLPTRSWLSGRLIDVRRAGLAGRRLQIALAASETDRPRYDLLEVRSENPQALRSVVPQHLDSLIERGARWLLLPEHALSYADVDEDLRRQAAGLSSVWRLEASNCGADMPVYDRIDAYFLPLSSHGCITRPGPSYRLLNLTSLSETLPPSNW
ncbi:MAG: phospholipid carrier-dependent glycosyltransferase [Gemmatimonadetes bacterium]|nr:phospholipid carrier-dependent glycosyltransferase [Gemmatimonadota bacterium]MBT5143189.1 phospholipid carrier-dependent glycosyltransferase [Gemmatimonadota bacterium]MBT7457169.1 phospholipid carrier-dependent glycosyltransferase [Gemmatimonadota bacterium]